MKKSVLFFGALLIIVLGYYFLNNKKDNSQEQVAQEKAQVTEEKVINVGVLQSLTPVILFPGFSSLAIRPASTG